jgi:hypothetical protein
MEFAAQLDVCFAAGVNLLAASLKFAALCRNKS